MATSKKTGPTKGKSSESKPAETKADDAKIEDSKIIEEPTSADPAPEKTVDEVEAVSDEPVSDPDPQETPRQEVPSDEAEAEEPASAPEPERTTAEMVHPVPVTTATDKKGNSFFPLVLGGVIAGAIGFFAGQSDLFSNGTADFTTKLRSDLNAQQERLVALETAEPAVAEAPAVDLAPLETRLEDLETRLAALEARPAPAASGASVDMQAYAAELDALQSSIETQRGEIQALLDNARTVEEATAEAAKAASAQAAIAKIVSAIDAGQPFAEPLAELNALDMGEVDPALGAVASDGVVTLSSLQAEFPDQARTALASARASGVEEGQQGLGGFIKRSLGARSVAPREGNDPDAVLSRAEAAIKSGDLPGTLAELDTLPEEAQAAISDWRAAADARVAARAAADALSQRLTAD